MSIVPFEDLFHEFRSLPPGEADLRLVELAHSDRATADRLRALLAAARRVGTFLEVRGDAEIPAQLGRYPIRAEIGRGSWGVVYAAEDVELSRPVAIKLLRAVTAPAALGDEARALAAIVHPNVAQIHALERFATPEGGERHGLVMEYVPGTTLAATIRGGALDVEAALDRGRQIAAALEAAHARGIVHLDLKPQNVRVTPEGWVKVLDFGLAATLRADGCAAARGGTPGYMSPEQERGAPVDARADLHAFGCLLFELLVGRLPEESDRTCDLRAVLPPDAPSPVAELLQSCLQADPARRQVEAAGARRVLEDELLRLRARALFEIGLAGPAIDASDRPQGNLPRPTTSFVGRESLLAALGGQLRLPGSLTLVGPGGVGKTRTAIEAVRRYVAERSAGVWFVDLAAIPSDDPVAPAITRILGIPTGGALRDPREAIAQAWQGRAPLLVLDNCEHVLADAADTVAFLRDRIPALTVLATSRAPLGIAEERLVPLASLGSVGQTPAEVDVDPDALAAAGSEAVALFLARARARVPEFSPGTGGLATIAAIVRHLDGLPLAIELAASQVRTRSLDDLFARVVSGAILGLERRGGPDRHRSLADLVAWSYRLLPPAGRRLLARLSMFRGGFSLASVEVVGADAEIDRFRAGDLVAHLVECSLVQLDEGPASVALRLDSDELGENRTPDPEPRPVPARYRLLETIRVFADEQLTPDEREELEERFVAHCLELSAPAPGERLPSRWSYLRRIRPDYDNLAHGLALAVGRRRLDQAVILAERLSRYWAQSGGWSFGLGRMEEVLLRRSESIRPIATADLGALLGRAAWLAARCGLAAEARRHHDEALALLPSIAESLERAELLQLVSTVRWFLGDQDGAERLLDEADAIFRAEKDLPGIVTCLHSRAAIANVRGRRDEIVPIHEELVREARRLGDPPMVAKAVLALSREMLQQRNLDRAEALCSEAATILHHHPDPLDIALVHHQRGDLRRTQERWTEAWSDLLRSARIRLRIGSRPGVAAALLTLATVASDGFGERFGLELALAVLELCETGRVAAAPDQVRLLRASLDTRLAALPPEEVRALRAGAVGCELEELLARAENHRR